MYHDPVLLKEAVDGMSIKPNGTYVDLTFGGGGHSREILKRLDGGKLFSFDQDKDAHLNEIEDERFTLVKQNFRFMRNYLRMYSALPVDGVLADLGVSSHQFDEADRGFSIRFDADLDMRMDQAADLTAKKILNEYDEVELKRIFWQYGELKNAAKLADRILYSRANGPIERVEELKSMIENLAPRKKVVQFFAQVFQALRIEVNDELGALREVLMQMSNSVVADGRLVVISYHSLEDRLVKNYMRTGNLEGKQEKDFFGNLIRPFDPLSNKVIVPTEEEIERNSRARSAKMRIGIKRNEK